MEAAVYSTKRGYFLLVLGALLGFVMVFSGLVERWGQKPLPEGVVARIGEQIITRQEYEETLDLLAGDKRDPLTEEDKKHVLNRILDEKLLIQRGLELGLVESDRDVRKAMTAAMIQAIIADAASDATSDDELKEYYQENTGYFTSPPSLRVIRLKFSGDNALAKAQNAVKALNEGQPIEYVKQKLSDPVILPVPNVLLPLSKLREYIGPEAVQTVMKLPVGAHTEPQASGKAYTLLYLKDKREVPVPAFEKIRDQVVAMHSRHVEDQALRDYLQRLRKRSDVQTFL